MTFTIRKGVPAPAKAHQYPYKYPFRTMEPGDSFLCPEGKHESVRRAAHAYATRNRGVYRVAKGEDGLWACWRLA